MKNKKINLNIVYSYRLNSMPLLSNTCVYLEIELKTKDRGINLPRMYY